MIRINERLFIFGILTILLLQDYIKLKGGESEMTKMENYHFGSIIDGKELDKDERTEVEILNPYSAKLLGKIVYATATDAENAVTSAHRVYTKTMKKMPIHRRAEILRKMGNLLESEAEQFARILTIEGGKPIKASRLDVAQAAQAFRFSSQATKLIYEEQIQQNQIAGESRFSMTKRISLGVVVITIPFNYPLSLLMYKMAPALAAGNTIVLNPSENMAYSMGLLYRLFEKSGMPKGIINIVVGPPQKLLPTLITHPKARLVLFDENSVSNLKFKDTIRGKKIDLKFSIKNPIIIFDDADLEYAVAETVNSSFLHSEQSIMSAQQLFVHKKIYHEFLKKLTNKAQALKLGNPLDEAVDIGPMTTFVATEKAQVWIGKEIKQGAKLWIGGSHQHTLMEPTVISGEAMDKTIDYEAPYAPIIRVVVFDTNRDVEPYMNRIGASLQLGVFTLNRKQLTRKESVRLAIEEMTEIKLIGNQLW